MPESGLTDFFGRHSKLGKLLFTISPCNCKLSFFENHKSNHIKFDFQISQFYFDAFFKESVSENSKPEMIAEFRESYY